MITRASRIDEILKNPIGRDIFARLSQYANIDLSMIDNPIVRRVRLSAMPRLSGGKVDLALVDALIELLNQADGEMPAEPNSAPAWWKEAVIYQIYPRSFQDSNHDGIGDLRGIINRLDYLQKLGVTALWLSPVYDSPNDDNGYDIRDYRKIMAEFGTMEDIEMLIAALHERGMRLVMDMVLNHTSDEHEWFKKSKSESDGPYGDYYIWKKSEDGAPNNWQSLFSGSAWTYYPERDAWAMHLFSKKQMDLNWKNEALRRDICDMIRFWREKGVDGFRLDVINFISKSSLDNGNETIGGMLGMKGVEHYFYGKSLHTYLKELRKNAFADAFTVGETPGTGNEMNKLLTAPNRHELNTVFCFDHIDEVGKNRFDNYRYNLNHLKKCFIEYESDYADYAWPTIFTENHDNPRMVSKVEPSLAHQEKLAKLIAMLLLTARGTVFLYQGQELGMANVEFSGMDELRDVESINRYQELVDAGEKDPWTKIVSGTRDHARVPMAWDDSIYGGFSDAAPWIRATDKLKKWNAAEEEADENSVLSFYKKMIALRKEDPALVYGTFQALDTKKKDCFTYRRTLGETSYFVVANLTDTEKKCHAVPQNMELVLSNYETQTRTLQPYEARLYRSTSKK